MYVRRLTIENVGPIRELDYRLPFTAEGKPKPVILVGSNGSGKSILLSHVVNSLMVAQQLIFDDCEVEKGRAYKYRSPNYITSGKKFYFAKIELEEGIETIEWQLTASRDEFEKQFGYTPNNRDWKRIPGDQTSAFWTNMRDKRKQVEALVNHNCIAYFPANRFEEPAWLNYDNLTARAEFSDLKHIQGRSNRTIIQYSPLARNRDWLLDVLFDRHNFDIKTRQLVVQSAQGQQLPLRTLDGYDGPSTAMYDAALEILRLTLQCGDETRLGFGPRWNRQAAVMRNEKQWIPDVFQLSTGETSVLNLFLSVLRDYDLTGQRFEGLQGVRGVVLIDEIDAHLHCDLQTKVLPALLQRFPSVQFIVSSHSPLFLLGLRNQLSDDGFEVLSLPDCKQIGVERFAEFDRAYEALRTSSAYEQDLASAIEQTRRPVVFVEGDHDVRYLRRAAELLGHETLLDGLELLDGGGFGNLDKVWRHFDCKLSAVSPRRVILLYDCDTHKSNADRGGVVKRVIPSVGEHPIPEGIENLLPHSTISRARDERSSFIDVTPAITRTVRGEQERVPERLEVNRDEKGNLCDWVCENGAVEDFRGFEAVFDLIAEALADWEREPSE